MQATLWPNIYNAIQTLPPISKLVAFTRVANVSKLHCFRRAQNGRYGNLATAQHLLELSYLEQNPPIKILIGKNGW